MAVLCGEDKKTNMKADSIYSLSDQLKEKITALAGLVERNFSYRVKLEEYIVLPDYGQRVVLRFGLKVDFSAPEKADEIESMIRELVGDDYWAVLEGRVFYKFGFSPEILESQLSIINNNLPDHILELPETIHSQKLREDAKIIRKVLKLPKDCHIWEIEVPIVESSSYPVIRIVNLKEWGSGYSEEFAKNRAKLGDIICTVEYLKNNDTFKGMLKSYIAATKSGKAVVNYIMGI